MNWLMLSYWLLWGYHLQYSMLSLQCNQCIDSIGMQVIAYLFSIQNFKKFYHGPQINTEHMENKFARDDVVCYYLFLFCNVMMLYFFF